MFDANINKNYFFILQWIFFTPVWCKHSWPRLEESTWSPIWSQEHNLQVQDDPAPWPCQWCDHDLGHHCLHPPCEAGWGWCSTLIQEERFHQWFSWPSPPPCDHQHVQDSHRSPSSHHQQSQEDFPEDKCRLKSNLWRQLLFWKNWAYTSKERINSLK